MTHADGTNGGTTTPQNVFARTIGIVTAPSATFARLVQAPRVLDMLALTSLTVAACLYIFLSTETGRQAWIDESVRQQEAWGQQVSDQAYQGIQSMSQYAHYMGAAQGLLGVPLVTVILAGILFAIFNGFMAGGATFKQAFSVVLHAGAVSTVGQLFIWPLNYMRGTMSSATNLSVFLPMLEETSFVAKLLGTVDLIVLWWLFVLAIGLGVLYRKKPRSIFIGFMVVYAIIAVVFATLTSG